MIVGKLKSKIKLRLKQKMFNEHAVCGKNLVISQGSYCTTPKKEQFVIGDNCELASSRFYVLGEGKITIGNNTTVRYDSKISSVCGITIGNSVIISNNVRIYDHNSHPTDPVMREKMCASGFHGDLWSPTIADKKPVVIEDNVWIGEHSTIMKGVRIGKGSIVASNAVVTKDVPPYTIVAGNPAKIVKKIEGYEE